MASIADLVRVIASVEGFEENFVSVYARSAREAGLISHFGRGRNAARMTPNDAANLLIAVNASPLAKEVPATIANYKCLRLPSDVPNSLHDEKQRNALTKSGVYFTDALSFLLSQNDMGNLNIKSLTSCELSTLVPSAPPPGDYPSPLPPLPAISVPLAGSVIVEFVGTQPKARILAINYEQIDGLNIDRVELASCKFYDINRQLEDLSSDRTVTTSITSTTLTRVAELIHS